MRRSLVVLCVLLPAFLHGLHDLDGTDIWLHLAAGEQILETRSVGPVWLNTQWLPDIGLALVHRALGFAGLVLWCALMAALAIGLPVAVGLRAAQRAAWPYVAAALLALLVAYERFFARPEMISLVFAAAWVAALQAGALRSRRGVMLCIAAQVIWSNAHGAFLLGPALATLEVLGLRVARRPRPSVPRLTWLSPLLLLLASCINPYGVKLPLHVFASSLALGRDDFRRGIVEWQPTFQSAIWGDITLVAFVISLACVAVAALRGRRTATFFEVASVVVFIGLAVSARRHLALYAITVLPIAARWWADAGVGAVRPVRVAATLLLVGAALAMSLDVLRGTFYQRFGPARTLGLGVSQRDHAIGAARLLTTHNLTMPVFNNIAAGSYLLWERRGQPAPFVDGRLLDAERFRFYRSLLSSGRAFDAAAQRYGFEVAVFSLTPHPPALLFRHLERSQDWQLVYLDGQGATFVRQTVLAARPALNALDLSRPLPERPRPEDAALRNTWWQRCDPGDVEQRGRVLLQLGYAEASRADLSTALLRCSDRWDLSLDLSSALLSLDRAVEARPFVESVLRKKPRLSEAWVNLGLCQAQAGNWPAARHSWEQAQRLLPADPRAAKLLENMPQ